MKAMERKMPPKVVKTFEQRQNEATLDIETLPMSYSKVTELKPTLEIRFTETFHD